ncbi:DNA circularization N-terminal domain-containing protein [Falsiroseomonas sp.]|uniref:DNA circularization N-terminal domain-containing protein n=1 Tax=Falsiroseomonas sp. TaxID=2870721 RepID=UPI0027260B98|nr:DNA circularization N-terminal domain-containing protein [Falsiroseomonas sp.]MDO9501385.1 DNA circularization N-terminal domain-containing protein [Falsiroseomonas sp.]
MSLSLSGLFDELQEASFRGVAFQVPAAGGPATGRRLQRFSFPGLDHTVHQDLGALDGDIRVDGLIAGDDYIQRAQQLQEAFRAAGPATLVHPWYGERTVVLSEPTPIEFDAAELRIARFTAVFQDWKEAPAPALDTLGLLLLAIGDVQAAVRGWLRRLLAPVRRSFGAVNAVAGFGLWTVGSVRTLAGGLTNGGVLLGLLAPNLATLAALGGIGTDDDYADAVADALLAPAETIAAVALPAATPAIGPGGSLTVDGLALAPGVVAGALLAEANRAPNPIGLIPAPVLLAAQCAALCGGIAALARIPFASRQQAQEWLGRADAAILSRMAAVADAAGQGAAEAAALYQALAELRSAVARDFRDGLGRLPRVRTITVPGPCSVWAVASWLAGDDPAIMTPLVEDLVARNRLRQPAAIPAGTVLEYLA